MADKRREATPKRQAPGMNVVGPMMPSHSERRGQFMRALLSTLTALIALFTIVNYSEAGLYDEIEHQQRLEEYEWWLQRRTEEAEGAKKRARRQEIELLRRVRKAERRADKAERQLRNYEKRREEPTHKKIDILRKAYHGCEVIYDENLPSNFNYNRGATDVFTKSEINRNKYQYPYADGKFDVDSTTTDGDVSVSCELLKDGLTVYGFTMKKEEFSDGSVELSARSYRFDNGQTALKLKVSASKKIFLEVESRHKTHTNVPAQDRFYSTTKTSAFEINAEGVVLHDEDPYDTIWPGMNLISGSNDLDDKGFILEAMMRKLGLID